MDGEQTPINAFEERRGASPGAWSSAPSDLPSPPSGPLQVWWAWPESGLTPAGNSCAQGSRLVEQKLPQQEKLPAQLLARGLGFQPHSRWSHPSRASGSGAPKGTEQLGGRPLQSSLPGRPQGSHFSALPSASPHIHNHTFCHWGNRGPMRGEVSNKR